MHDVFLDRLIKIRNKPRKTKLRLGQIIVLKAFAMVTFGFSLDSL